MGRVQVAWLGDAQQSPASLDDFDESENITEQDLPAVRALLADSAGSFNETADLGGANGEWHVWRAGCHNHLDREVVTLFRAIAAALPGSYGVLYADDDEASEGWDRWVMRRDGVHRKADEDLSPHVRVVEDPWADPEPL